MKQSTLFPSLAFCHFADRTWLNNPCSLKQLILRPRLEVRGQHVTSKEIGQLHETSSALLAGVDPSGEIKSEDSKQTSQAISQEDRDPSAFFELMSPITSVKPDQMSASSLAYLGDVVFELFVRSRYVWPSRKMSALQNKVVSVVRAEAQSLLLQKFIESFPLTPTEQGVLARGRNANLTARKKGKSVNSSGGASAYQDSTAFEALIGYTYISDINRFNEMISWIKLELDELDSE